MNEYDDINKLREMREDLQAMLNAVDKRIRELEQPKGKQS